MFKISTLAIFAVLSATAVTSTLVQSKHVSTDTQILARNGADDAPGDKRGRGNDGVGHASLETGKALIQFARNGADDAPGDKRGRGNDGAGHASLETGKELIQFARNGANDAPGDKRGRGNDGVGHA
jgi:hypothetical protein